MGFWDLLVVASMPVVQVMLIGLVGAFLASDYLGILTADARAHLNKVVYIAFTPSLLFASLAKTITLKEIISWWVMPVNIGLTFVIGGTFGWTVVKLLRPKPHLRGLVIGVCSAGNLGNLMITVVPAICNETRAPFGEMALCRSRGLSYASFSMALGSIFIWTHTHSLMKNSAEIQRRMAAASDLNVPLFQPSASPDDKAATPANIYGNRTLATGKLPEESKPGNFFKWAKEHALQIARELMSPPPAASVYFHLSLSPEPCPHSSRVLSSSPHNAGGRVFLWSHSMAEISDHRRRRSLPCGLRFHRFNGERDDTVHHSDSRREPHPGFRQVEHEALGDPGRPFGEDDHPPDLGDRRDGSNGQTRPPPPGHAVPLRTTPAVHDPPRHEHRHDGAALRRGQGGMLRHSPLDLRGCGPFPHPLVHSLPMDLIVEFAFFLLRLKT